MDHFAFFTSMLLSKSVGTEQFKTNSKCFYTYSGTWRYFFYFRTIYEFWIQIKNTKCRELLLQFYPFKYFNQKCVSDRWFQFTYSYHCRHFFNCDRNCGSTMKLSLSAMECIISKKFYQVNIPKWRIFFQISYDR